MMKSVQPAALAAQQRANLIYTQARAELSNRLWQAALGNDRQGGGGTEASVASPGGDTRLDALITMLNQDIARNMAQATAAATPPPPPAIAPDDRDARPGKRDAEEQGGSKAEAAGLGVNAQYRPALEAASARTGIPANALAAIVNAEAAKGPDGRWLAYSRNPRSSAAGLGQFLSGTWIGEAERKGSWLNDAAASRGWLDARGRVRSEARSDLLALRYNGDASINATADYARVNLDALERAGVRTGGDGNQIARAAYLGHHLGVGDAIRFLRGGLDPERARILLHAQIGGTQARRRIAESGSAVAAHREWLLSYVERNVRPDRFAASNLT